MQLSEQIIAIVFSYFFGVILAFLYNFNYNFLFRLEKITRIIFNIIFILDLVLIYFLIMRKINNAVVHPYFYFVIFGGFISLFKFTKRFRTIFKVDSNKKSD